MSEVPEFPLPSLRQFLVPGQVVHVRTFLAPNLEELDRQINGWINETKAIVAVPGPVTVGESKVSLALTYVKAAECERHV